MIGLILTVLTVGAVSASDDVISDDELTANDNLNQIEEVNDELSLDDDVEVINQSDDDSKLSENNLEIKVYPNQTWGSSDEDAYVAKITGYATGNITVSIDDVEKYNREYYEWGEMPISFYDLNINCGVYNMKINFINETTTKLLYDGPLNLTYSIDVNNYEDFDEFSDWIEYDDYLWEFRVFLPRDATGTLTVNFNGNEKELTYYRGRSEASSIPTDGLSIGEHKIRVSLTNDPKYPDKTIEHSFYICPKINVPYYVSVGEKEFITVEVPKEYNGVVKVYNNTYHEESYDEETGYHDEYYEIYQEIGSAQVVNGMAKIPVKNLIMGKNYITVICDGDGYYKEDEDIINYIKNSEKFTSSISSEIIEVGSDVTVKINGPKSSVDLYITIDDNYDNERCISLEGSEINEKISGLSVGEHKIKLTYHRSSDYYSNTFYVTVKEKSAPQQPSNIPSNQPKANSKPKITLTLKKVAIKKSAKKLILTATLKQGKTPLKNKKITFKFNGKKYTAKTNKKGIAKVTIKKKILKKLKVGKKIKYQASFGKLIKKVTVKVKK